MPRDLGLLLLRIVIGALMVGHGLGKIGDLFGSEVVFPDPIGLGAQTSLALAAGAETFGALLVLIGLCTRFAALPVVFTMGVAAFVVHREDVFGDGELALVYAATYAALVFTGPGRWSVDGHLSRKRARRKQEAAQ
ncbi:MAG TPA: DoxX family protein [Planctomycetota bacterium]